MAPQSQGTLNSLSTFGEAKKPAIAKAMTMTVAGKEVEVP